MIIDICIKFTLSKFKKLKKLRTLKQKDKKIQELSLSLSC